MRICAGPLAFPAMAAEPYQLLPALSAEDFAALKADVAARGVLVAVEVDEAGAILDGHHRVRAWSELRAEGHRLPAYPRVVRRLSSEADKVAHVLSLNLSRRHLDRAARAELVGRLRAEGWSIRRIAASTGLARSTVAEDVASVRDRTDEPERVLGLDGRARPARRAVVAPAIHVGSDRDERRARAALAALGEEAPARLLDLRRAENRARLAHLERLRTAPGEGPLAGPSYELRCSAMAAAGVAEASLDAIVCDPPYGEAFLEVWSDLGAFAARTLRPGRLLVAYTGHRHLPEALARLSEHLHYVWTGATFQPGRHATIRAERVWTRHRPWLVFSAGPYRPRGFLDDTLHSEGRGERAPADHPWRQTVGPFRRLVAMVTKPGEVVCDPCCGSGTTGVAALAEGRAFLGIDVDSGAIALASAALAEAAAESA